MDDHDLLETLLKDFPRAPDDELRFLERLQAFGKLDIGADGFSAEPGLARGVARRLVRSAGGLGNCTYKASKGPGSRRRGELLKSG